MKVSNELELNDIMEKYSRVCNELEHSHNFNIHNFIFDVKC